LKRGTQFKIQNVRFSIFRRENKGKTTVYIIYIYYAKTMTTTRPLQLLLFTFLSLLLLLNVSDYVYVVHASIEVIDIGKSYQSRPDKYVGLQMRTGIEYSARLQRIPGDQHLCGDNQVDLTIVPDDGLPGT
jgi:hypothetical protein